jgi:outer membrane receptor protein involved in Fe transport
VAPKFGIHIELTDNLDLRGFYTKYLNGLYFDNSFSIQPNQLAGFNQAYRNLVPQSVVGLVPAAEIQSYGSGLDFRSPSGNIFSGIEFVVSSSDAQRGVGAMTNSTGLPIPDTHLTLDQYLEFTENRLSAYFNHIVGSYVTLGMNYTLADSRLHSRFPVLPTNLTNLDSIEYVDNSLLFQGEFSLLYNHPSGWFGRWASRIDHQWNDAPFPDESIWRHDILLGYRFPRRRLEVMVGVQNLTDQSPQINPLNFPRQMAPQRTIYVQAVVSF